MVNIKYVGLAIQFFRLEEGYTQDELSEILDKEKSAYLTRIESGIAQIPLSVLNEIAECLEIRMSEIIQVAEEIEEAELYRLELIRMEWLEDKKNPP